MIWNNTKITVEGSQTLFACFESNFVVSFTGATLITVTYHSALGISPATYYADDSNKCYLPTGDLVRALTEQGITGSTTLFTAVDDVDGTPVAVTVKLERGYNQRSQDGQYPPRVVPITNSSQRFYFGLPPVGTWPQAYTIEQSIDGGATWSTLTTGTTDGDIYVSLLTLFAGKMLRLYLDVSPTIERWRGQVVAKSCNETALVEWVDDYGGKREWTFEVEKTEREVNDTRAVADTANFFGGTFPHTKKNWTWRVSVVVRGLTESELCYFDSLVTGEVTNFMPTGDSVLTWAVPLMQAQPVTARVTDKKITNTVYQERNDLRMTFEVFSWRTF